MKIWLGVFFLAVLSTKLSAQTASVGASVDAQLTNAAPPGLLEYRAVSDRLLALGEYLKRVSEAEYNNSLSAKNYARANLIQGRARLLQTIMNQIGRDQRLIGELQRTTGVKAMRLMQKLDTLRWAKTQGYFTSQGQQALATLSAVSVEGMAGEDVVEAALLSLRARNKRFEAIISEHGEIAPLPAENFELIPLDPDRIKKIKAGLLPDPRLLAIEDFPGGSAADLYVFAIERRYRFKLGKDAYRLLGVALSAIEEHAIKKVKAMMEDELQPIRNSLIRSWKDLVAVQKELEQKDSDQN